MNPTLVAVLLAVFAYLIGSIPFGYLIGRMRGVDLFREGSGNIGATNTARVLGKTWGFLVFALDFAKGAIPVAVAVPLATLLTDTPVETPSLLRVIAAAFAFLGHLFPVYLGFRGGKGVATGAGAVSVLAPLPAILAIAAWVLIFLVSRTVSIASIAAVSLLALAGVLAVPDPFGSDTLPITLFLLAGSALVIVKHRANIQRCLEGTEKPVMKESESRQTILRALHLLALAMWFGGSGFFNFVAAPTIFRTFGQVVTEGPSDRTAGVKIIEPGDERTKALGNALAGTAVGPIFPKYFAMQAGCVAVALLTSLAWWNATSFRKAARWRVGLLVLAAIVVALSWPLSNYLSDIRPQRFSLDPQVKQAAVAAFDRWHFVSLGLSVLSTTIAGVLVVLAAKLPRREALSAA